MAFAELSGSLLVRRDTDSPVSVAVAAKAARPIVPLLQSPIVGEPEHRCAIDPPSPLLPKPHAGIVGGWRGARLITCIVCCVAVIGASVFLVDRAQTWRTGHTLNAEADGRRGSMGGAVAPPAGIEQPVSSARTPDEHPTVPVPAPNDPVPGTLAASPVEPDLTTADEAFAPSSTRAPEPERRLSQIEVAALVERGDALFSIGDITSARLFYQYAADAGDGAAALRLGEAFDPAFLERARLGRAPGDEKKALHWYLRASELGNADAKVLLKLSSAPAYPEK
jgi:hypothetical protein